MRSQVAASHTVPYLGPGLTDARTKTSTIFSSGVARKGHGGGSAISIILEARQPIAGRQRLRNSLRERYQGLYRDLEQRIRRQIAHLGHS